MKSFTSNQIRQSFKIGVFGSDGDHCSEKAKKISQEIGKLLAENNMIVITGGGSGVMEYACKGAFENNGLTINILPGSKKEESNKYASIIIPTGIGFARGQIITNFVDGAIIIEGGLGTIQEAAFMYWLQKPTIAISSSGGYASEIAGKKLDNRDLDPILEAESPKQAIDLLIEKLNKP